MFAEQYKKISELYDAHEKSISNMIEKNSKIFNERLNNLPQEIRKNYDSIKQLKDNTRDFEESLIVNQDLVEEKLNTLKSQMRSIKNEVSENKAELRTIKNSRRPFEEKQQESTLLKKMKMKHGKTQRINRDLFCMTNQKLLMNFLQREEGVKCNSNNTPRTIVARFLDYKEKEEVMRRRYKLKDTTYLVREDFSKETVEIRKKL